MKRYLVVLPIVCLSLASVLWAQSSRQPGKGEPDYLYVNVDVPHADIYTEVRGINDHGAMVGIYAGSGDYLVHGFLLVDGTFTYINYPGATETYPRDINNRGQIVGFFFDAVGDEHGFLLQNGKFFQIDYPGALASAVRGINDIGQIVGDYWDGARSPAFVLHNRKFTAFEFPEAQYTFGNGIDNQGNVVGSYIKVGPDDPEGVYNHGYVRQSGTWLSYDVPGAALTLFLGMNDRGQIAGYYNDREGEIHGFLLDQRKLVKVEPPGGATKFALARSVNNRGFVVGNYLDPTIEYRGYLSIPLVQCANRDDCDTR